MNRGPRADLPALTFHQVGAEVYVPEGTDASEALVRTTHLGVGAHPDDLEILAAHGIVECFDPGAQAFAGVIVTDGAGSARAGEFAHLSDTEMRVTRRKEQRAAAKLGRYSACVFLDYPSSEVNSPSQDRLIDELTRVLRLAHPQVVYTHNLFDKHTTHVSVVCALVDALRRLSAEELPDKVIGCEVWRDLDWVPDSQKVIMDVSRHQELQEALLGVFQSQIAGGKRYDLGTMGRRRAHATFCDSHGVDFAEALIYGLDLMPLVLDPKLTFDEYMRQISEAFFDESSKCVASIRTEPSRL